jgi:hypothetical protein
MERVFRSMTLHQVIAGQRNKRIRKNNEENASVTKFGWAIKF